MELILKELGELDLRQLYEGDFVSLEDKSEQETAGVFAVADALRRLREKNYDVRIFQSGLGLALGQAGVDFYGACDLLGLRVWAADGGDMLQSALLADVIGAGDEKSLRLALEAEEGYRQGLLPQRPTVLDLELADPLAQALWLIHGLDGAEHLREAVVAFDHGGEAPAPEDSREGKLLERMGAVVCPMEELFPQGKEGPMLEAWVIHTQGPEAMEWRRYRPYVIAAMIFLAKAPEPVKLLRDIQRRATPRRTV